MSSVLSHHTWSSFIHTSLHTRGVCLSHVKSKVVSVFLYHLAPFVLRQGFSFNMGRLAGPMNSVCVPQNHHCYYRYVTQHLALYLGVWDLNSCLMFSGGYFIQETIFPDPLIYTLFSCLLRHYNMNPSLIKTWLNEDTKIFRGNYCALAVISK